MHYRKDIDGLRALAVMSTIGFHSFPKIFSNGYLSVDFFFVISGFLITSIIINQSFNENFSLVNFYCRRIKRILPPALLVLAFVTLVGSLTLFQNEFWQLRKYIKGAGGFYINFQLLNDSNYFEFESTYKPLLHYWALAIEEQFYLVWPIVFTFIFKVGRLFVHKNKLNTYLSLSIGFLIFPSLIYFIISKDDLFFSSFARMWELMIGCFGAVLFNTFYQNDIITTRLQKWGNTLFVTAISLLFFTMFLDRKMATVLCVLAAFILVTTPENISFKKFLKNEILIKIGLMSFSLYLWHWPIISFYHIYKIDVSHFEILILIIPIFALSFITYQFLEKPLKESNWNLIVDNKFNLNFKRITPIALCLACSFFFYSKKFSKLPDLNTAEMIYVEDSELDINTNCELTQLPNISKFHKWCYTQNLNSAEGGLLIGDSQAHALFRGFSVESKTITWHLVGAESCPPFVLPQVYEVCKNLINDVYSKIAEYPKIKNIVYVMSNKTFLSTIHNFKDEHLRKQLISTLKNLITSKKRIFFVRPIPEYSTNIGSCSRQRFSFYKLFDNSKYCRMQQSDWINYSQEFNTYLNELKLIIPEITILDFSDTLCDGNECHVIRNNKSLYQDNAHLSFEGNKQAAKKYLSVIERAP